MKIKVHSSDGHQLSIPLPNAMLFSPTLLKSLLKISKRHTDTAIPEFSPETIDAVCRAIKDYNRKHGSWELVHVESAGGDTVIITI